MKYFTRRSTPAASSLLQPLDVAPRRGEPQHALRERSELLRTKPKRHDAVLGVAEPQDRLTGLAVLADGDDALDGVGLAGVAASLGPPDERSSSYR